MDTTHLNSIKNSALSLKPSRTIQLFLMVLFVFIVPLVSFGQTQTFNTSGTFIVPTGVTSITAEVWGAGGAGGGSTSDGNSGAGGGAGGYTTKAFTVTSGASIPYVVGSGGTGSTGNGLSGGNSSFSSITANGGNGGKANGGAVGAGGTASGGSTNTTGGSGNLGGGSVGGKGGNAPSGGGIGGNGSTDNNGLSGNAPGGGGGGGEANYYWDPLWYDWLNFTTDSYAGGNGGNGQIKLTYTCPTSAGTLSGNQYLCTYGTTTSNFSSTSLGGTWSSSNTGIATVNTSTGVVTAKAAGSATITYSVGGSGGCTLYTATRTVYVANGQAGSLGQISYNGTAYPASPSPNLYFCKGTTSLTFSIPGIAGVSGYVWSGDPTWTINQAPDGLSATVTFSAGANSNNIQVVATNGCTNAGTQSYIYLHLDSPPTPTFTSPPGATTCANTSVTYTTTSGMSNYAWSLPGISGTDYTITSGGIGASNNTVTLKWLTAGTKTVTVNYAPSCIGSTPATNTTVVSNNTASVASSTPTLCINSLLTNITHTTTGSTGISNNNTAGANGLPAGVKAVWASNIITISGTPTASGIFNYSIPLTGGCGGTVNATGTITVSTNLSAAAITPNTAQTFCPTGTGNLLTANPTGGGVVAYQWGYRSTSGGAITPITGQTTSTYTPAFTDLGTGTWYVVCTTTSTCGSPIISNNVTVTITGLTVTGVSICTGGSGSLTASGICANGNNQMAGPNYAGTGAGSWTSFGNVNANDNNYATYTFAANSPSSTLSTTNYNFAIPTNATIQGIQVIIGRKASAANKIYDNSVKLLVGGSATGSDYAGTGNYWAATEAAPSYGSATDLWGISTLTPAIVNASNFGVVFVAYNNTSNTNRTASVDYISMSITYTLPGSLDWYTVASGGTKIGSGSPFNPVGVASSGLADTNTATTKTFYVECSSNAGCRTPVNYVINSGGLSTPTIGTPTQPNCVTSTGSVALSGLPASGTWTINPSPNTTGLTGLTGTGTTTIVGGLTANTTYTFTVSNGTCTSSASAPAVINAITTTTYNGSTWSTTPDINMIGVVNSNTPIASNVELCSCTVNTGVNAVVNSGVTLKLQDKLTVAIGGSLTFNDSSSLVQINDVANSGNIIYKRNTSTVLFSDYTYWSSPVANQNLNISTSYASGIFYSYNDFAVPEDWKSESASTIMAVGKGYIIRGSLTSILPPGLYSATFTGVPNNGTKSVAIGPTGTSNLIGNPYPSAINANTFLSTNSGVIDGTIYLWTHNTAIKLASDITNGTAGSGVLAYTSDDYASYNTTGGVGTGNLVNGVEKTSNRPSGIIAAGQAFFTTSILTGGTVTFNNAMRLSPTSTQLSNTQFFKTKNPSSKTTNEIEKNRVWLNLTNAEGAFKQTLVGYVTGATNAIDSAYDGESFDGQEFIDFYSINEDKNLTIQGRALPFDENDEVPLGFRSTIEGSFTINIDEVDGSMTNQDVFIEDKLTHTTTNLKTRNYTFNTVAGTFDDRFVLKYKASDATLGNPDLVAQANSVLVSIKNKQIEINAFTENISKIAIFDLRGRQIYQKDKIKNNEFLTTDFSSSHQVLLVKTILQNGAVATSKIVF